MKIKVIDLLNMIAEGKEVPKKIKFNELEYYYDELYSDYMHDTGKMIISLLEQHNDNLNHFLQEDVEIIKVILEARVSINGDGWLPKKEIEKL